MSISIYNSTTTPLLSGEIFEGLFYDNILEFSEINISINCDVGYTVYYIYSQDKENIDYVDIQVISTSPETIFIKKPVYDRYFKLKIEATNGDMTVLNVQTIYKTNISYNEASGVGSDVNITNSSLNVNVLNYPATQTVSVSNFPANQTVSGSVSVSNFPANQTVSGSVSVSNFPATQTVSVSNFPATQPVSGSVSVSNSYIDTHITQQTAGLALDTTLQSINAGQKTIGSAKVWDNASVLLNGVSSSVGSDSVYGANSVSIYGYSDTTTTIAIQLSNDNITFYTSQYSYNINTVGDFGFSLQIPFKYIRLINKGQNVNSIIGYINFK